MKTDNPLLTTWVGERIRHYRKLKGLSQEELAEAADLHRTYIGSCERGERNITIINLAVICEKLDVSLYDFFKDV